jgi:RimJ/RimL family protein N-acetyltransferase
VSGKFIGELGFADFKRALNLPLEGLPELGWALTPSAHGNGYATEALQAVVAWGDQQLQPPGSFCIIHRDNRRSFRVAEKLGYNIVLQAPTDAQPDAILARQTPARIERH